MGCCDVSRTPLLWCKAVVDAGVTTAAAPDDGRTGGTLEGLELAEPAGTGELSSGGEGESEWRGWLLKWETGLPTAVNPSFGAPLNSSGDVTSERRLCRPTFCCAAPLDVCILSGEPTSTGLWWPVLLQGDVAAPDTVVGEVAVGTDGTVAPPLGGAPGAPGPPDENIGGRKLAIGFCCCCCCCWACCSAAWR